MEDKNIVNKEDKPNFDLKVFEKEFTHMLPTDRIEEHLPMLEKMQELMPVIQKHSNNFMKTQSQFMDNMLTVNHHTDMRNMRQILAEVNSTMNALREAYFKIKKENVKIEMLKRDMEKETDELKKELLAIKIDEKLSNQSVSQQYISGAIRKVTNHISNFENILKTKNMTEFDEKDFEDEEEEYHIKRAFMQGLCAARSHNGIIDEGNQIYCENVGINGGVAQREVTKYLIKEEELYKAGQEPTYEMYEEFLTKMAEKFKGCAKKSAEYKKLQLQTDMALLKKAREFTESVKDGK
jgi:phosphopantetheinyl transferase (holo-ACP synthase)